MQEVDLCSGSIEPDAGFEVTVIEAGAVDSELEMTHTLLFDEEHLFLKPQLAPQADAVGEPDLDLVPEREVKAPRHFVDCQPSPSQPMGVPVCFTLHFQIQLTLLVHS